VWDTEKSPLLEALQSNAKSSCDIGATQRGQKPLNTEAEEPFPNGTYVEICQYKFYAIVDIFLSV
jgi:hypothetical protein